MTTTLTLDSAFLSSWHAYRTRIDAENRHALDAWQSRNAPMPLQQQQPATWEGFLDWLLGERESEVMHS